jgi:MFS family permease
MGMFGAVFGVASVIGPFIGGLLTDAISWHWVFFVNLPVGLVALAFIAAKLPKLHSGVHSKIDYAGAVTLLIAVVPLLLALTLDKAQNAWDSPLVLGMLGLSIVGLVLFLVAEMRASAPILPLHLFRNRTFALTSLISVVIGVTLFAAIFFLSIYMVNVLGVSATEAGTTLIPLMLSLVTSSIVSSNIVQRTGRYKPIIIVGMTVIVASLWWLTTLSTETSTWMVRLRMIALGLGLGPALPMLNLAMQNAVPREDIGAATASRQFFQQIGQVIGSAVFGAVLTTSLTTALTANLAPIQAQLPPAIAAQIDPAALRNGGAGGEGAPGAAADPAAGIERAVAEGFAAQRDLLTRAMRDADPAAIQALMANPQTPAQLKELLPAVATQPAAAREQALTLALAMIDDAQAKAVAQGKQLGAQIGQAVKISFTDSITAIYRYSIGLALIALALACFLPELTLRKSHNQEQPMVMME